ncbi:MAG TPA: GFA family protein [Rhizobiaceae bacterium]|nr:GFA family protein [Rhizobiaceae bacterium]
MKKDHHGSCHCGAVTFDVTLDLDEPTSRCNCSMCSKARFWKAVVPAGAFRLTGSEHHIAEYTFGGGNIHHRFCRTCGVKVFGTGELPETGAFVAINVLALDDVSPEELAAIPVFFEDGRHDRWEAEPAVTSYL